MKLFKTTITPKQKYSEFTKLTNNELLKIRGGESSPDESSNPENNFEEEEGK